MYFEYQSSDYDGDLILRLLIISSFIIHKIISKRL